MFKYLMSQINEEPTMKTILAHATASEDSPRNGARENDGLGVVATDEDGVNVVVIGC